ncbi:MAG: hypothetical protein AAF349_11645 [Cyanobacteria bacterium P01_A01_bin.68]
MKFAKILSLGLVAFALLGCNQTPAANNNANLIESAEQVESNVSQNQDSNSISGETTTPTSKSNNSSRILARNSNKKNKTGKQIGARFDCNGDGKANGARIDYNGDGIPDDCIESNKKTKSLIDETSYDTALKSLDSIIKGCRKSTKTPRTTQYTICKNGGKIVKASEYNSEAGAGLDFWFNDNQVIAVQRPHSQELFIYDNSGKLKSKFNYPRKVNISNADLQDAELLYNGYNRIVAAFDNKSTAQNNSSGNRIIDETSFQSFSKSLEAITNGCQKTKKSGQYTEYEICKKDGTIVNASEYSPEAGAGLAYWFAPDGRVAAMRYLTNGDTFTFDSNGKVSAKFNIYDSKKINNISAEERNHAEGNISKGSHKDILQRF